jgi:tripartite-type tricarboxylate transporter receptor subunit TctC
MRAVMQLLRLSLVALAAAAVLLANVRASSAQSGPPIKLIVGTPAGGAIDAYARIIGDKIQVSLNRSVLIENKVGAGGNIAARGIAEAPADGSLIWVGTQAMVSINPSVYKSTGWKISEFTPLIKGIEAPLVFAVHPSVPAKTFAEFLAWAKANAGKLSYSSYTPGTPSHFLGEQMNQKFKLDLNHVAYRGSGPQANDLLAGHALMGFTQLQSVMELVKAGKIIALATTGEQRSRYMPDVPTFAELGYPEFMASIWFGMLVKAGTPPNILDPLMTALVAAHKDSEAKAKLEAVGFDVSGEMGEAFRATIERETKRWAELVKATGFSAD